MLIFFIISSCEKEEFVSTSIDFKNIESKKGVINTPAFLFEMKKIPTAELLAKSENFQNLNKLLTNHINLSKDYNQIKKITSKASISKFEEQQLILSLGYNNEQEFITFISEIQNLNNLIADEFDFENVSDDLKSNIVISAFETISIEMELIDDGAGGGGYCNEIYASCRQEVTGNYQYMIFGCGVAGFGIATGSFGIGTPAAYALTAVCIAAASNYYNGAINHCYYSYLECNTKN
jgi:hypothetical protein